MFVIGSGYEGQLHCTAPIGKDMRKWGTLLDYGADVTAKKNNGHWGKLPCLPRQANQRAIANAVAHGGNNATISWQNAAS